MAAEDHSFIIRNYIVNKSKCLGSGKFGKVYLGHHKTSKEKVALKKIKHFKGEIAIEEIKNLQLIPKYKHIVEMIDYYFIKGNFWIVMEYCDIGDLEFYMLKYRPRVDKQLRIMHQSAGALAHLHSLKTPIIHSNISPRAILFKKSETQSTVMVKLTGFGLSKISHDAGDDTRAEVEDVHDLTGSHMYRAPEVIKGDTCSTCSDVYSLGIVFATMLNFKPTDERLIPLSDTAVKDNHLISVAEEMLKANDRGSSQPHVVAVSPLDKPIVKMTKQLVQSMTAFQFHERLSLSKVLKEIAKIDRGYQLEEAQESTLTSLSDLSLTNISIATCIAEDIDARQQPQPDACVKPRDRALSLSGPEYQFLHKLIVDYLAMREKSKSAALSTESRARMEVMSVSSLMANISPSSLNAGSNRSSGAAQSNSFERYELVQIHESRDKEGDCSDPCLQDRGIVLQVHANNRLEVEFVMCKRSLVSATQVKRFELEKPEPEGGDLVHIIDDEERVKRLQRRHGGWIDEMSSCLGRSGIVKKRHVSGRVMVEVEGQLYIWNSKVLKCIAKAGELAQWILAKAEPLKAK